VPEHQRWSEDRVARELSAMMADDPLALAGAGRRLRAAWHGIPEERLTGLACASTVRSERP
jgi:hypothetical protein